MTASGHNENIVPQRASCRFCRHGQLLPVYRERTAQAEASMDQSTSFSVITVTRKTTGGVRRRNRYRHDQRSGDGTAYASVKQKNVASQGSDGKYAGCGSILTAWLGNYRNAAVRRTWRGGGALAWVEFRQAGCVTFTWRWGGVGARVGARWYKLRGLGI